MKLINDLKAFIESKKSFKLISGNHSHNVIAELINGKIVFKIKNKKS